MPDETTAELEAPKTKRKAPAKKAAAVKKPAAKKTVKAKPAPAPAPVEEIIVEEAPAPVVAKATAKAKPARKTAAKKKASPAAEEAPELNLTPASAAAAPAPAEITAAAPEAPAPASIVSETPAAPASAADSDSVNENDSDIEGDDDAAEDGTTSPSGTGAPATPGSGENQGLSRYTVIGENGQPRPMTAKERRKAKFERWKQRRAERDAQRRAGRDGGPAPHSQNGSDRSDRGDRNDRGDRDRDPSQQSQGGRHYEPEPPVPLGPPEPANGILEMSPKGYGFLRRRELSFTQHPQDAFIAPEFIRKYGLREGMQIVGVQCKGARGPQITEVTEVNGRNPLVMRDLPLFEELKAVNPNKRYQLETVKDRLTTRVIDMMTPVGRGQRGLIVAAPRAGKTTILQHIAEAVVTNHPGTHLMILLVDERPEEVTEFKRILPQAEIYASNNDQDVKSHTRISTFAIERAKRLVECGEHVFMLMDSITRMARAFNNTAKSGAVMSGGVGVGALEIPRRLFAAARNTRTAGSLTILGTALVETGTRMDDLIFQEFKGTGNMELVLDRKIAEQFVYPAVNIFKSGTRREELLLQAFQLDKIHMLRRGLAGHKPVEAIQRVISLLERYPSNAQMLVDLPSKS
ncbi:transcription termination factor Rho [Prosthecobacter sp.]|uniref:transcription termination factor Rho n=1 Tax=Prosthecobacter sp. TaxID=1965333 RepID=UPI003782ED6A